MDKLPERKNPRLKEYDYSAAGSYFITICVKDRARILSSVVGCGACDAPRLSSYGRVIQKYLVLMDAKYPDISVDHYVIMPNHIHLLITIHQSCNGASQAPHRTNEKIPKFVSLFKRYCNREYGKNIFQRSYYDHIIRDEDDYYTHIGYIESNPATWAEDKYYI